jgi:hypothetical protein
MVELNKGVEETIMAKDLKDGQLAVIVGSYSNYEGRIVQKYGDDLVAIGLPTGNGWTNGANVVTLAVRVLRDGEILTVLNNECYV